MTEKEPEATIPSEDPNAEAEHSGPSELDALRAELEQSQAQAAEYLDGWKRALADFDNYKKRIERENGLAYQNAVGQVVRRYLPIIDDLERALQNRPADPWADGIELILRKLHSILEAEGVTRIDAEGQMFDPNIHEAVSHEDNPEHESGQIIAAVQHGYRLGERVLRPAAVRVAK